MAAALVYGLAITGEATVRALQQRGWTVTVADDRVTPEARATAASLGVDLVESPSPPDLRELVRAVELVSPSPGLAEHHLLFAAAAEAGVPVRSELELAYRWEQDRPGGPRPMVGVTGTDGKTTAVTVDLLTEACDGPRENVPAAIWKVVALAALPGPAYGLRHGLGLRTLGFVVDQAVRGAVFAAAVADHDVVRAGTSCSAAPRLGHIRSIDIPEASRP